MAANNSSSATCSDLESTALFYIGTICIGLISIGAILANLLCLKLVAYSGGGVPANVKLMLINCNVAFLVKDSFFVWQVVYHILLIKFEFQSEMTNRINFPNNYFPISKWLCSIFLYFYMIPTLTVFWSMFFIGLERFYVTFRKNVGDLDLVSTPMVFICVLTWFLGSVHYLGLLFGHSSVTTMNEPVCYCYMTAVWKPIGIKMATYPMIVLQCTYCILFCLIYLINKRYLSNFGLNTARHSLSERFVTWSNVKTTGWLLPIALTHSLTSIATMLLVNLAMVRYLPQTGPLIFNTGYVNFVCCYLVLFCMESLIHPVLCIRNNEFLRRNLRIRYPFVYSMISNRFCRRNDVRLTATKPILLKNEGSSQDGVTKNNEQETNNNSCTIRNEESSTVLPDTTTKTLTRLKRHKSGKKIIVEYRIPPDANQGLLEQMWNSAHK